MLKIQKITKPSALPWFKEWFNSEYYHKLYANRDEKEAKAFIDALLKELNPHKNSSAIDVGCGAGRHSIYLASQGFNVLGIDTAYASILQAKIFKSDSANFIHQDMREPFGKQDFDYVFNFFTSFGYFDTQEENQQVINNMCEGVKRDGKIVIDYLNVNYADKKLVRHETKEIEGVVYYIFRWTDKTHFYKRIIIDNHLDFPLIHTEKVARYKHMDFEKMFSRNKMKISKCYGDYLLNNYTDQSPRLIMIIEKK